MPCYHPLTAFTLPGAKTQNGKDKIFFDSKLFDNPNAKEIKLPCGQCIGCRLEYSRQWAVRCMLEASKFPSDRCWFVTLTYDDEHVPKLSSPIIDDNGEVIEYRISYPLKPKDLQDFNKRLLDRFRQRGHTGIRFFACGEYGDLRGRPHYHILFFNLPLFDLKPISEKSKSGALQYESDLLSSTWNKGLVRVGELNFQSCAYTARYIVKKHKGLDFDYYEKNGLVPEFVRMSRNPGISRFFYEQYKNRIYFYDNIVINTGKASIPCRPPRYFDRLYDIDFPSDYSNIKLTRQKRASDSEVFKFMNTSKSYYAQLLVDEEVASCRCSQLLRDIE